MASVFQLLSDNQSPSTTVLLEQRTATHHGWIPLLGFVFLSHNKLSLSHYCSCLLLFFPSKSKTFLIVLKFGLVTFTNCLTKNHCILFLRPPSFTTLCETCQGSPEPLVEQFSIECGTWFPCNWFCITLFSDGHRKSHHFPITSDEKPQTSS